MPTRNEPLNSTYQQSRICSACGHQESRRLPELEAAFEERRRWDDPCGVCGGTTFGGGSFSIPEINAAILDEWANNKELTLMQQDEELLLAETEPVSLLFEFVQRQDIPKSKRRVLLESLCVAAFDYLSESTGSPDIDRDSEKAELVVSFLRENSSLFEEIGDRTFWPYITERVYPLIGRKPIAATYRRSRSCRECGHVSSRMIVAPGVDIEEIGIQRLAAWRDSCSKCGNARFSFDTVSLVLLENELENWAQNDEYTLEQPDTEITLAKWASVDLLAKLVQRRNLQIEKRRVLLESLCHVICENAPASGGAPDVCQNAPHFDAAVRCLQANQWLFNEPGLWNCLPPHVVRACAIIDLGLPDAP